VRDNRTHTITPAGELDLATAAEVDAELLRVEGTDAAEIVLDLSELTFCDSSGVRLCLAADTRSRADSDRLSMIKPPDRVYRVFVISGLVERLPWR
jgi:anti-anti-sigma factor